MTTGIERNHESINQIFNSETDHQDYIMKQLNDAEKHLDKLEDLYDTAEYFAKEDDLIGVNHASRDMKEDTYTLRRKTLQTKSMMNSRKSIKSDYDEFYVSCGECGQDGTITVRKLDGKWKGDDGKTFMGYLTPEEIVDWYSKDYGSAWLNNSRKPIKSERVTNGGKFTNVMFELINELKLKKDYQITRPSWDNFDFSHKYRDGSFTIYIDEKSQVVYGSVLGFGEHDNDVFNYETEKVNVDSYNLKRECRRIIIDCMNYLDNTIEIVSFE